MKLQARNFVVRKPETTDITMFFKSSVSPLAPEKYSSLILSEEYFYAIITSVVTIMI